MHTISELFDVRLLKRTFTYSFILLIGDDSNQAMDNFKPYVEKRLNDISKRLDKISKSNEHK